MRPLHVAFATTKYGHEPDTLLIFLEECVRRGWRGYWFEFDAVEKRGGVLYATLHEVLRPRITARGTMSYERTLDAPLELMDAIFLKRDTPVDARRLRLLSEIERRVLIVNRPSAVLRLLERASSRALSRFMPLAFFSRSPERLERFARRLGDCVVKESNSSGGKGVHHLFREGNEWIADGLAAHGRRVELGSFMRSISRHGRASVTEFLREAPRGGDKRIIALEGEIIGAMLRRPKDERGWISNISAGGRVERCRIAPEEREMVAAITPALTAAGVPLVGFDTLPDNQGRRMLSEANTTNVGGFYELRQLYGRDPSVRVMDWLERRLRGSRRA